MSKSKKQSLIIIAIALIIIGIILAVFALSQPKIYVDSNNNSVLTDNLQVYATDPDTAVSEKAENVKTDYPVDLNSCTYDELLCVDGIGEARASAIIEYRDAIGSYTSVEQIKNIEGIGESLYEKISPYLFV